VVYKSKIYIGSREHIIYHYKTGTLCQHTNKCLESLTVNYNNKIPPSEFFIFTDKVKLDKTWKSIFDFAHILYTIMLTCQKIKA
jgi:hypothetical protein